MKEKRAFPRIAVPWDLEIQVVGSKAKKRAATQTGLRDISGNGFCFRCDSAIPPGALIRYALKQSQSLGPMVGMARIIWNNPSKGGHDHGAKFVEIDKKKGMGAS